MAAGRGGGGGGLRARAALWGARITHTQAWPPLTVHSLTHTWIFDLLKNGTVRAWGSSTGAGAGTTTSALAVLLFLAATAPLAMSATASASNRQRRIAIEIAQIPRPELLCGLGTRPPKPQQRFHLVAAAFLSFFLFCQLELPPELRLSLKETASPYAYIMTRARQDPSPL